MWIPVAKPKNSHELLENVGPSNGEGFQWAVWKEPKYSLKDCPNWSDDDFNDNVNNSLYIFVCVCVCSVGLWSQRVYRPSFRLIRWEKIGLRVEGEKYSRVKSILWEF